MYAWDAIVEANKSQLSQSLKGVSGVGMIVVLAYKGNPTKAQGEKYLVPHLAQKMGGWRKDYPPTKKKFPVGIYVPVFGSVGGG